VWSNLGLLPQPDEIEVTLIGPGYGESVVVHLGQGEWLIVDSCVDSTDPNKPSVPLQYLRQLGVKVEDAVKFIVVSHWDDDHVRGLGEVVEACLNAKFVCSKVFPDDKFINFVAAHSIGSAATDGAGVRNFRRVLDCLAARSKTITKAVPGRKLCGQPIIQSWSPSDYDDTQFLFYVAQEHPKAGEPLRKAIPGTGNLTSIVLSIDWPESSVLLGADMEHSADRRRGWGAVVSETQQLGGWRKGHLVKIPHHGSHTGHHDGIWNTLLESFPISLVAPFGGGAIKSRPPKSSDIRRISTKSRSLFVTARHLVSSRPNRSIAVNRSLRDGKITMTGRTTPIGMVRVRRKLGDDWKHELFGAAYRVK